MIRAWVGCPRSDNRGLCQGRALYTAYRLAREIVKALHVTLTFEEDRRLAHRSIRDVRALELYLQARQESRRLGVANERGLELLKRAIAIEGETAPLLAQLAWAKVSLVKAGVSRDLTCLDEAAVHADALLAMAPEAPYGYAVRGYVAFERGQLADAVRDFRAALEREPNDADVLFYLGIAFSNAGAVEDAEATARRLMACDPLSPLAWLLTGVAPWFGGRWDGSVSAFARALELDPQNFIAHWTMGYVCAWIGQLAPAAKEAEWLTQAGPQVPYTLQLQSLVASQSGDPARGLKYLASIDARPLDFHITFHISESFAMAGAPDRALAVLEEAVEKGFYAAAFIETHCPFMAPLRGMPEFGRILAKAKQRATAFTQAVASPVH